MNLEFSKRIYFSFILLMLCSTIISIAGISGFQRLAPAINTINDRNTQSLYYAEQMLTNIASKKNITKFEEFLNKSKENITERNEKEAIENIEKSYKSAFAGNFKAEEYTIENVVKLTEVNRNAMKDAGIRAEKLKNVGIWIIIFPTIFVWCIGLALLKNLDRTFIKPLCVLKSVISEFKKGNKMRRCPNFAQEGEFQNLYNDINHILDSKC